MVTPNELMKRPTMPPMKAIGRKTAISDRLVAVTAKPISRVASTAAWKGDIFFSSMKRKMFSSTTTASSITMPTARVRPKRVIVLSVKPITFIAAKAAMIEAGMATPAIRVGRSLCRKSSTMMVARNEPRIKCSCTLCSAVRM